LVSEVQCAWRGAEQRRSRNGQGHRDSSGRGHTTGRLNDKATGVGAGRQVGGRVISNRQVRGSASRDVAAKRYYSKPDTPGRIISHRKRSYQAKCDWQTPIGGEGNGLLRGIISSADLIA